MNKSHRICPLVLAVFLISGCASTQTAAKPDPTKPVASNVEYEYYTPTGSNVAVKVPKQKHEGLTAQDRIALEKSQNSVNSNVEAIAGK